MGKFSDNLKLLAETSLDSIESVITEVKPTPLFYVVNSLYLLFTIAELALVFVLSARVQNMSVGAARGAVSYTHL